MIEFMEKNMVEGKTIESEDNKLAHNHTVINQWTTFSEINQHVMARVKKSISAISELTENKTIELSQQFQSLSNSATEQTNRIVEMSHLAKSIVIDGQEIEISEITRLLQETFLNSITCILDMSKKAMIMIYSLDDSMKTLNQIEKSIKEIEKINHKTKYLSLNATIEAVRAGEAGESFQVVASEVRDLSNDTQTLATNISDQVSQLATTVRNAQEILQNMARIDLTTHLMAKDQLDEMINGLVDNSVHMGDIMAQAMTKSQEFSQQAVHLISSIQFQDRVKQDFDKILKDIEKTLNASEQLRTSSANLENNSNQSIMIQCTLNQELLNDLSKQEDEKTLSEHLIDSEKKDDVMLF
jgi:methyl-accepting chemotaxis protein